MDLGLGLKSETLHCCSMIMRDYSQHKNKDLASNQLGQQKRRLHEQLEYSTNLRHKSEIHQSIQIVEANQKLLRGRFLRFR